MGTVDKLNLYWQAAHERLTSIYNYWENTFSDLTCDNTYVFGRVVHDLIKKPPNIIPRYSPYSPPANTPPAPIALGIPGVLTFALVALGGVTVATCPHFEPIPTHLLPVRGLDFDWKERQLELTPLRKLNLDLYFFSLSNLNGISMQRFEQAFLTAQDIEDEDTENQFRILQITYEDMPENILRSIAGITINAKQNNFIIFRKNNRFVASVNSKEATDSNNIEPKLTDEERNSINKQYAELMINQEHDKAEELMLKAVEKAPDDISFLAKLGHIYLFQNKINKALHIFKKILEIDPANIAASIGLVRYYMQTEDHTAAIKVCENVLEYHPRNTTARHALARSYLRLKKYDLAIEYLKEILDINENDHEARISLSKVYKASAIEHQKAKRYPQAIKAYTNAIAEYESAKTFNAIANNRELPNLPDTNSSRLNELLFACRKEYADVLVHGHK